MSTQYRVRETEPQRGNNEPKSGSWLSTVLAIAAGIGLGLLALPVVLFVLSPSLEGALTGAGTHIYWYISRASAFVAFVLLWMSMLAGLGITSKLARFWPGMPQSFEMHRFLSLMGLGFGTLHAVVLLGDAYINFNVAQLMIPFMGTNYRPEWVGLGQLAFYSLAVVAFSYYFRDRLGIHTWRLIHGLSFALFLMVIFHGLQSGTDSHTWWAQTLYWGSAASVLFATVYRIISVRAGQSKQAVAASGLVAVGGKSQVLQTRRRMDQFGRPSPQRQAGQAVRLPVVAEQDRWQGRK